MPGIRMQGNAWRASLCLAVVTLIGSHVASCGPSRPASSLRTVYASDTPASTPVRTPTEAAVVWTRDPEQVSKQFLRAVELGQADEAYALTSPRYRRVASPAEHAAFVSSIRDRIGTHQGVTVLERAVGIEPRGTYGKLAYEIDGSHGKAVIVVGLLLESGHWRVVSVRLNSAGALKPAVEVG
jgi:hypothetical protein